MTTITKPAYNSFLDDLDFVVYESPSGKYHVEGWFGDTVCGTYINFGYKQWGYKWKVSLRYLGKIANQPSQTWCKRCMNNYRGMNVD
jgi:hypothetical protein